MNDLWCKNNWRKRNYTVQRAREDRTTPLSAALRSAEKAGEMSGESVRE